MRIIKNKIKSQEALKTLIIRMKKQGKRIAFTNGCFDILHYGHVDYLQKAKMTADILIVAVNSDSSVRRIKGNNRPINNLKSRLGVIAALESVDFVTTFSQNTPLEIITLLKPNFIIKGADWKENEIVGRDIVKSYGGYVKTVPIVKGFSSTLVIEKILQRKNSQIDKN